MPISDTYIVRYLLQETRDSDASVVWRENGSGGHTTCIHGLRVELESLHSRAGSRLCLSISCVPGRIYIEEPAKIGLFREKYRTEEQRHLAELMNELGRSVARQCDERRERLASGAADLRQTVFQRLIGAVSSDG